MSGPDDAGGSTMPEAGASMGSPSSQSTAPPAAPLPPAPETDLATVLARMNARFDRLEALIDRPWVGTIDPTGLHHRRTLTLHPVAAPPVIPRSKPGDGA